MYINKFDVYINGNFFVSGYLYYEFSWILYNKKQQENRKGKRERERGKEELPLKQKATVCTPQRVRIVAAFLLFDFGAFNHGQIFILLFFEKRLKIV